MSTASTLDPIPGRAPESPRSQDVQVMGLIALVHGVSHFFHLIIVPLFPWLIADFGFSYSQLGLLMTVFFVVSGTAQSVAGFVVDRAGPVPVLLGALGLFVLGALVLAGSNSFFMFAVGMALAGLGNASFHPIDFSIINTRVRQHLLGRAYAVHGISGSLGWAIAPVFLAGIASLSTWRMALVGAALLAGVALAAAFIWRGVLLGGTAAGLLGAKRDAASSDAEATGREAGTAGKGAGQPATAATASPAAGTFDFLRLPAVWMSFGFFVVYAFSLGGVQSFAPSAAGQMFGLSRETIALCLTVYMLCSAGGMIPGGWVATSPERAERLIAIGFGGSLIAALSMLVIDWPAALVPVVFGIMGFSAGFANPARDLLIKRSTPPGATGRVYGVVYSGLDVGMSFGPFAFGLLMDAQQPQTVWLLIGLTQVLLIGIAWMTGRMTASRTRHAPA